MASTSTTGIAAGGAEAEAGAGVGGGAVEELPPVTPADVGGRAAGAGALCCWPKMLALSLSKMPMGCLTVGYVERHWRRAQRSPALLSGESGANHGRIVEKNRVSVA